MTAILRDASGNMHHGILFDPPLRSRFGHLTANGDPGFAVSGFMLSVYPYLEIKIREVVARSCHDCFYSFVHFYLSWGIVSQVTFLWNIVQYLISERVLKRSIFSQTWECDVLECKNLAGKSLTSGAWSSRTNVNLKPQSWRQGTSHVTSSRLPLAGNAAKPQSWGL